MKEVQYLSWRVDMRPQVDVTILYPDMRPYSYEYGIPN